MNIRKLTEQDWDVLSKWWASWPKWKAPVKDFLPNNGTGGVIVEVNGKPVVAGFIYFTNSKTALLEWIISDPEYRENDREAAIELLITGAENLIKASGYKYLFAISKSGPTYLAHLDPDRYLLNRQFGSCNNNKSFPHVVCVSHRAD